MLTCFILLAFFSTLKISVLWELRLLMTCRKPSLNLGVQIWMNNLLEAVRQLFNSTYNLIFNRKVVSMDCISQELLISDFGLHLAIVDYKISIN